MQLLIATRGLAKDDDKLREWLGCLTGQALSWAAPYFAGLFNTTASYVRLYNLAHFLVAFNRAMPVAVYKTEPENS